MHHFEEIIGQDQCTQHTMRMTPGSRNSTPPPRQASEGPPLPVRKVLVKTLVMEWVLVSAILLVRALFLTMEPHDFSHIEGPSRMEMILNIIFDNEEKTIHHNNTFLNISDTAPITFQIEEGQGWQDSDNAPIKGCPPQ
uniref:Uncharacterized protein n=1 Tax=Odontella aurita TaxID=265563 RepID=A0A7S4MT19_9STRA|mmetsp:Transcript_31153/g.93407  ORF Transcript_31153/g.93407 Transcript_31153/m.93407 type:complete len:139 (+) Transcript_31153:533-949(+)